MARPDNDQTGLRKLSMVGQKTFAVSLPLATVKTLGWQKGQTLQVRRWGDKLIIERTTIETAEVE